MAQNRSDLQSLVGIDRAIDYHLERLRVLNSLRAEEQLRLLEHEARERIIEDLRRAAI